MRAIRTSASALLACIAIFTVACGDDDTTGTDAGGGGTMDSGTAPMCEATGPENTAAACGDECDNDGDDFADCDDRDCCGVRTDCPATTYCGRPMDGGTAMACEGPEEPENTLAACSDGCSNDGDTFADCNDFDCCDARTDCPAGTSCGDRTPTDGGVAMQCPGDPMPENTLEACSDGCSNDIDTRDGGPTQIFADCNDRDCCGVRTDCPAGTYCGDMGPVTPENTLELCTDGVSMDGNTFADCRERTCCLLLEAAAAADPPTATACAADTYCGCRGMPGTCFRPSATDGTVNLCPGDDITMPPAAEDTAEACGNGCDDDRNGYEDCEDFACAGLGDCPARP